MLPAWLAWLLPIPVATLAAVAWVAWSGRQRRPADPLDTVADYARFRKALAPEPEERPAAEPDGCPGAGSSTRRPAPG